MEGKIEIISPIKRVYEVLKDAENMPKWNLNANEITIIESENKASIKTKFGEMIFSITEDVENEKISYSVEGGPFTSLGYFLIPKKGDTTEITIWAEFDDEKLEKILEKAGETNIKCLKSYVEYLEDGGDIDDYDKNQVILV